MRNKFINKKNILLLLLLFVVMRLLYSFFNLIVGNFDGDLKSLFVFALFVVIIVVIIVVILISFNKRLTKFVYQHSISVKELIALNNKYAFTNVKKFDFNFTCDNESYYSLICPIDYLIYQLQFNKNDIKTSILNANSNLSKHQSYVNEVNGITNLNRYDSYEFQKYKYFLSKIEKKILNQLVERPITNFTIYVRLILTDINGRYKADKVGLFKASEILNIIEDMSEKSGLFYKNDAIWQSICRIERAKVSNRIRFYVYNRDGHRCVRCGSRYNLEVDHIFPISKGGKSTVDNLQTLCHNCNTLKSNKIQYGAVDPKVKRLNEDTFCPICGAPTIVKYGKYGKFLACTNFPKCKFTKSI